MANEELLQQIEEVEMAIGFLQAAVARIRESLTTVPDFEMQGFEQSEQLRRARHGRSFSQMVEDELG